MGNQGLCCCADAGFDDVEHLVKYGPAPADGETAEYVRQGADVKTIAPWISETLKHHNELRRQHGAPPLRWSHECAAKAQICADTCASRHVMQHSSHREHGHGQNIFWASQGGGAKLAVQTWYEEAGRYIWRSGQPSGTPGCGHFTQVVWKDAQEVGMTCDRLGRGFIVANYWPAGNVVGQFDDNVFPQGTRMQRRKQVRRLQYSGTVTELDAEVESVLNSVPQKDVVQNVKDKLQQGWTVTLFYKPAPQGQLNFDFKKGGTSQRGTCTF